MDNELESYDDDTAFNLTQISEVEFNKTKSQFVKRKPFESTSHHLLSDIKDKAVSEVIFRLVRKQRELVGKLRATKEQLALKDKSLAMFNNSAAYNPLDMSDSKLQFAFLFASPLVRSNNKMINSIMQLG